VQFLSPTQAGAVCLNIRDTELLGAYWRTRSTIRTGSPISSTNVSPEVAIEVADRTIPTASSTVMK